MLDRPPADADRKRARQQRYRARRRQGDVCYRLELGEFEVIDALITSGRLSEGASRSKPLVEAALVSVINDFAARWKI